MRPSVHFLMLVALPIWADVTDADIVKDLLTLSGRVY